MEFNLYEVVSYGSDQDPAGANGEDTCFLVRARSAVEAGEIGDLMLRNLPHERTEDYAQVIHLFGTESECRAHEPGCVRGPYYQHAISWGWPTWYRDDRDGKWDQQNVDDV